jgi:putative DNA primase/helicase
MVVDGEEFDQSPHYIACNNGIVNLETGECEKGVPEEMITLFTPHDWPGLDAVPEKYEGHLASSLAAPYNFGGSEEDRAKFLYDRTEYFQRFCGSSLHGTSLERAFMIFYGEHGWNGKGMIMAAHLNALGDYAAPMAPEVLLKTSGAVDPSKPSPHILAMKGRRFLFASETDEGERFSPAKVKLYSGGERQVGRNPHDTHPTYFDPMHTIFLLLNDYPYANANDNAFWDRMHVLRFFWSYKDNPVKPYEKKRNPTLEAELKAEAPAILAWMVRGYHKYLVDGGLNPPAEVLKEKATYRFREDTLGQFIHDCCKEKPDLTNATSFSQVYNKYVEWYQDNINDNPKNKPSKKSLGTKLGKRFEKTTTSDNLPAYIGLELKGLYDNV